MWLICPLSTTSSSSVLNVGRNKQADGTVPISSPVKTRSLMSWFQLGDKRNKANNENIGRAGEQTLVLTTAANSNIKNAFTGGIRMVEKGIVREHQKPNKVLHCTWKSVDLIRVQLITPKTNITERTAEHGLRTLSSIDPQSLNAATNRMGANFCLPPVCHIR